MITQNKGLTNEKLDNLPIALKNPQNISLSNYTLITKHSGLKTNSAISFE